MAAKKKKKRNHFSLKGLFAIIGEVLVIAFVLYLLKPSINVHSEDFWFACFIVYIVCAFGIIIPVGYSRGKRRVSHVLFIGFSVIFLVGCILGAFSGSSLLNWKTYRDTAVVEDGVFEEDFSDLSNTQKIIFLDQDTARRIGDRVLGKVPNASWYEVSNEYSLIVYQGKPVWISPLEYGENLFKYFYARNTGIPGYVIVDVESQEAHFIRADSPIRYSPSAMFSEELERHLRGQFLSYQFEESFFEVDDDGIPYWITGVSEHQTGLASCRIITGVIVTNASTGEAEYYKLEDRPEWIDNVFSVDFIMERMWWKQRFVHGFFNPSSQDIMETTYRVANVYIHSEENFTGYNYFIDSEGNVCLFTGVTSLNNTESNVGFVTVNCATGVFKKYDLPGAEESSVQGAVEGLTKNMQFSATFPFMVNVGGKPTYMMYLKDTSGLVQRVALVEYGNYNHAYVGETLELAINGYIGGASTDNSNSVSVQDQMEDNDPFDVVRTEHSGVIEEKTEAVIEGTTYYFYLVDGRLYKASITVSEKQVLFKPGDPVLITYHEGQNMIRIVDFIEKAD